MSQHTPRSRKYWKLRHVVRTEEPLCWLCGEQIDHSLRWPHPMSFSVDHIKSCRQYPELKEVRSNMRAAHLVHNQEKGDRTRREPGTDSGLSISIRDF